MAALAGLWIASAQAVDLQPAVNAQLQTAYNQMYDQNYQGAREAVFRYKQAHPGDPMGPLADATSYLLEQFHRLGILETDFFSKDGKIFGRKRQKSPDPNLEKAFDSSVADTNREAESVLKKSPGNTDALLAVVLAITLRADYDALVRDWGWQALKDIKEATRKSRHVLSICPECYDADLASGVENYILGQQSGLTRFFLSLNGAETDERKGIQQLKIVAEKGRYFKAYAKLLLAIAAKRQHDQKQARELISQLVTEYPNNSFFRAALKTIG
jgi:hypothetical protein